MQMVFEMMGKWAGSHWNDLALESEFWMKNYDEAKGHGKWDVRGQHDWFEYFWNKVRDQLSAGTLTLKPNTIKCIEAVFDAWNLDDVIAEWAKSDYNWGLTHGSFTPENIMVNPDDLSDMYMINFEFAGMLGNPGVDMATWTFLYGTPQYWENNETKLMQAHWRGLVEAGVDPHAYPYESLVNDYLIYGSTQVVARYIWILASYPEQRYYDMVDNWFDRWTLTPDLMTTPVYGSFDWYV